MAKDRAQNLGATKMNLQPLVEELVAEGASIVYLAGSRARGDAGPHSDIDLGALADAPPSRPRAFRMFDGALASTVWSSFDLARNSFRDPAQLGAAVPGWRRAILLHDPTGAGGQLVQQARAWTWDDGLAAACDSWAARVFSQLGEEVHKLCNALAAGDRVMAATRRNILAGRLPFVISVRRRLLYDTERALWPLVAAELGEAYARNQRAALAVDAGSFETTIAGALAMYVAAEAECRAILTPEQAAVARASLALAASWSPT